jgi:hypothetical protein
LHYININSIICHYSDSLSKHFLFHVLVHLCMSWCTYIFYSFRSYLNVLCINTVGAFIRKRSGLSFTSTWIHHLLFYGWIHLPYLFGFLCYVFCLHLQEKLRWSFRVFLYGLICFTCPDGQVTNKFHLSNWRFHLSRTIGASLVISFI